MSTTRTIEVRQPGPVVADLGLRHGRIEVIVERRDRAQVILSTSAKDGPVADAIRDFALQDTHDGFHAHLEVPLTVISSRTVVLGSGMSQYNVFSGRGSVVQVGGVGGDVVVTGAGGVVIGGDNHGVVITGDSGVVVTGGSGGKVEMQVRLPEGSSLAAEVAHCPISTRGRLVRARIDSAHGSINVDEVGSISASVRHGNLTIAGLDGDADLDAAHGSIDLHALRPCRVQARTRHGDITVGGARVDLNASTSHGSVRTR